VCNMRLVRHTGEPGRFQILSPARVDFSSFPAHSGWLWDPHISHFVEPEVLTIQINSQNLRMGYSPPSAMAMCRLLH
jgi:hypothetical protein